MDAKTCDRCGVIWYDSEKCKIDIRTIKIEVEDAGCDSCYDLCEDCRNILFSALRTPTLDGEDKTMRIFK